MEQPGWRLDRNGCRLLPTSLLSLPGGTGNAGTARIFVTKIKRLRFNEEVKFEKNLSILFVFSLLFMLTACSSSADPSQESSGQTTSPSSQQDSVSVSNAVLESESTESEQSANNTLIVYFSRWGNTEYPSDVDATTSASIVVDNNFRYGTTEYVANMIAENVGGDLHRIETVTPYTANFDELRDVNHNEMSSNYLPELKESNLDISAYDTVFIGYPVWATDVPQAVLSFLKEYDLSGKTVIPFCTHDGYGAGNSYQTIAEASHAAVSLEGIAIEAKDVPNAQDTVSSWLADIGISKSKVQTGTPIKITVGEVSLDGVLYDTELAEEIKTYFPLTISMVGYGDREYYGGVEFYPEHLEGGQKNFENGDITYCEAHHNMAIFYAQTDNPIKKISRR